MINLEWVSEYIDISNEDLKELALKITKAGINIEKVITNNIDNLVIGEVLECIEHPNSDHLHICQVDVKDEVLQIVCGAHNVQKGIKVIVAKNGATLPNGLTIKKSKIRDVESNGMLCALAEIGLEEENEENRKKGIHILKDNAKIGVDAFTYMGLSDTLYELDIHKHRNNDCYYHIGFAYEIGAIIDKKVTLSNIDYNEIEDNINNHLSLEVQTNKCSYYKTKMLVDLQIKESPDFIKRRLNSVGIRSINNVVDISNYVMLEYGQPLHFFDKDKLGNNILVRDAKENEEVITLDNKQRTLNSNDIVITDKNRVVAIAGVMGAYNTEVDENTKNIVIESAIFNPVSIRNTSSNLNLKSEASIRFGKGLNYEYTNMALSRACHLLEKYANAKVLKGDILYDKEIKENKVIEFKTEDINKMLGINMNDNDVKIQLNKLDFPYEYTNDKFIVTIPKRRLDIDANINDIAEEIGRLYGYHNLVSTLPKATIKKGEYKGSVKYRKAISKRLRTLMLNEVKTYSLTSPKMNTIFNYEEKEKIILPNPLSIDKSIVRTTIIPSLLNVYNYNKSHKVNDIMIYEIANTYYKENDSFIENTKISALLSGNYISNTWNTNMKIDFYIVKGIVENLLNYLGFKNRYKFTQVSNIESLHPGISAEIYLDNKKLGIIGRINPRVVNEEVYVFELDMNLLMSNVKKIKYKERSKYPTISRDFAFILNKDLNVSNVIETINKAGTRLLKDVYVFDVYEGEKLEKDKKSVAFTLKFADETRTLTDEEVNVLFNKIIEEVSNKHNAILRDN